MRASAALLVVALAVGCVAEGGDAAARRAARADSAAAGYPIAVDSTDPPGDAPAKALLERLRRLLGVAPRADSATPTVVAIAPPAGNANDEPRARPAIAAARDPEDAAQDSADAARASDDTASASAAAAIRSDTAATADPSPEPDSLLRAGEFLAYNPARRTVQLQAVAGYDGVNESLNFNGAAHGASVVTIPRGWHVDVRFRQGDDALAHSALVAPMIQPISVDAPPPAFPHAVTRRAVEGMIHGATDGFGFIADRAGDFVLQCGVPGHAQGGMWIRLVVDSTASRPRYH